MTRILSYSIPKSIQNKYGRYCVQAYVLLTRNGRTLKKAWDDYHEKENRLKRLKMPKQLKVDFEAEK